MNSIAREAEPGGSLSLRPVYSTKRILGQPELHKQNQKGKKKKKTDFLMLSSNLHVHTLRTHREL